MKKPPLKRHKNIKNTIFVVNEGERIAAVCRENIIFNTVPVAREPTRAAAPRFGGPSIFNF